jgi:hypothetical protein
MDCRSLVRRDGRVCVRHVSYIFHLNNAVSVDSIIFFVFRHSLYEHGRHRKGCDSTRIGFLSLTPGRRPLLQVCAATPGMDSRSLVAGHRRISRLENLKRGGQRKGYQTLCVTSVTRQTRCRAGPLQSFLVSFRAQKCRGFADFQVSPTNWYTQSRDFANPKICQLCVKPVARPTLFAWDGFIVL